MPRARSRAETAAVTRAALIRAGIELVGTQGLDTPSLDAICARARRTRGAFYVHFRDRDDFLVAIMDHVGREFLDAVLAADASDLATIAGRFLQAVAQGQYPLMKRGGVRPHQLLDACARSPVIRARYVALVQESITRVAAAIAADQTSQRLRADVDATRLAAIILAAVIGAQTMMELRVPFDPLPAARVMLTLLAPP